MIRMLRRLFQNCIIKEQKILKHSDIRRSRFIF
jgi:hypothetical protein